MKTITAKFIGEDGSLGFRNGSKYRLRVEPLGRFGDVKITSIGVLNKGQECVYSRFMHLLYNWTDIVTN